MESKFFIKMVLLLLIGSLAGCASKSTREQILSQEQSQAGNLLEEDISTNEIFDDKNIDNTKALVVAKVYSYGRKYIRLNGIPIPSGVRLLPSALLFSSLTDAKTEFVASGPSYHVYQVPQGQYYVSRIAAGHQVKLGSKVLGLQRLNYIPGSALDSNKIPQYGKINLQAGQVHYLGDIQTYGTALDIRMFPNFRTKDNQVQMLAYLKTNFPSIADKVKTQLFVVQNPSSDTKAKLANMEPLRLKRKRLAMEKKLNRPFNLAGESQLHKSESAGFIKRLKSSGNRTVMYRDIYNSWLNDPMLFDLVNDQVLSYAKNYNSQKTSESEAHWALKALASSGLQRYKSTFDSIKVMPGSSKLNKQAIKYSKLLDQRTLLARVVHSDQFLHTNWSWQEQHAANMIASDNSKVKISGSTIILKNELYKKPMLDHISKVLIASVKSTKHNRHTRKFQINLAKALARCKDINYRPVLQKVMALTIDKKVRKYAESYIDYLEDSVD